MVKTSDTNLAQPVKEITADAGYSSYDNYEYLAKNNKMGYIPDQNFQKDLQGKGSYPRDRFCYDPEKDIFLYPEGKKLKLQHIRRKDYGYRKFQTKIYKGEDCPHCPKKSLCTKQRYRTINLEDREVLLDQMRSRLQTETGRKKYLQRLWTTEPVFGHLKYNLGYRHFFLRSLKKVKGKFRLMCIGWNLKKTHKLMDFG
jgi:transposase